MKTKAICLLILCCGFAALKANAQNCEQKLREAQLTYEQGRIEQVPEMLKECLANGFTKEQHIAAYKLLVLNYLYYNEKKKAEEAMAKFLKLNPEYKIQEGVDPPEFINLYNSFRTWPVYMYSGRVGLNMPVIEETMRYSVDNTNNYNGAYSPSLGYQGGVVFEVPVKNFSIEPGLFFTIRKYTFTDKLLNYAKVSFSEQQLSVNLPVVVRYKFGNGTIKPFIGAGGGLSYLLSASATVVRNDSVDVDVTNREVPSADFDLKNQRNSLGIYAIGSAGVQIKSKRSTGFWNVDLQVQYAVTDVVNGENRTAEPSLMYSYGYIDNDFKMHSVLLNIAYSLPVYRPKLLKVKP